jgi:hypothetical protein
VTVTSSAESCGWVAATAAPWIVLLGQPFGQGSGAFDYRVMANTTTDPRTGTVVVSGASHTVTQAAEPPPSCTYTLSPGAAAIDVEGGTGTFAVTAPEACAWSATSAADWVVITAGAQGRGGGTVAFNVARHTGSTSRHATIAVEDQAFAIDQSGAAAVDCQYSVAPVQLDACMPAGTATFRITTQASCAWTVTADASWLTVGGASGGGTTDVTLTFAENYDAPRSAVAMVRWPTLTQGQNVRLSQAGCVYGVSAAQLNVPAAGSSTAFDVVQQSSSMACGGPTQNACVWTAVSSVSWIVVTTPMPQKGDGRVSLTIAPNNTGQARTGTVTVRDKVVQIAQAPS